MVIKELLLKKKTMKMNEERWNDLCNEGLRNACVAYENARPGSAEENLARCFRVMFTLLKESWKGDCQNNKEPIIIK